MSGRTLGSSRLLGLLPAALVVICAATVLGPPRWALAASFLAGRDAGVPGAAAVATLLCWIAIGVVALAVLTRPLRAGALALLRRPGARALLCLSLGGALLLMGALHHAAAGYRMCCRAGVTQAEEVSRLAR